MAKANKKHKGKRDSGIEHKHTKIAKIVKLEYIVDIICWCGNNVTIDSGKPITENTCSNCGSPHKLLQDEWTKEEADKFMEHYNKQVASSCQ